MLLHLQSLFTTATCGCTQRYREKNNNDNYDFSIERMQKKKNQTNEKVVMIVKR